VVVERLRTRSLVLLQRDIEREMTESNPLTYDEHKAAEAVLWGNPVDPDWTRFARLIYMRSQRYPRKIVSSKHSASHIQARTFCPELSPRLDREHPTDIGYFRLSTSIIS
jgi:hypothetical protein